MRFKQVLSHYKYGPIPHILTSIGSAFTILSTIIIIVLVRNGTVESMGISILIIPIILLIGGAIGLAFGLVFFWIKRYQKKIDEWSPSFEETSQEEDFIPGVEIEDEISDVANKEAIDWNKIHPLIIEQRNVTDKCPICKLNLVREDFIVQCPYCTQLFHGKHLIDWLLKRNKCPVCRKKIDIR